MSAHSLLSSPSNAKPSMSKKKKKSSLGILAGLLRLEVLVGTVGRDTSDEDNRI